MRGVRRKCEKQPCKSQGKGRERARRVRKKEGSSVCWSRGCLAALGETTLEQVYPKRLQFVGAIHVGEVWGGIATERRCYGTITTPQFLMSLLDRESERSQAWSSEAEYEKWRESVLGFVLVSHCINVFSSAINDIDFHQAESVLTLNVKLSPCLYLCFIFSHSYWGGWVREQLEEHQPGKVAQNIRVNYNNMECACPRKTKLW